MTGHAERLRRMATGLFDRTLCQSAAVELDRLTAENERLRYGGEFREKLAETSGKLMVAEAERDKHKAVSKELGIVSRELQGDVEATEAEAAKLLEERKELRLFLESIRSEMSREVTRMGGKYEAVLRRAVELEEALLDAQTSLDPNCETKWWATYGHLLSHDTLAALKETDNDPS